MFRIFNHKANVTRTETAPQKHEYREYVMYYRSHLTNKWERVNPRMNETEVLEWMNKKDYQDDPMRYRFVPLF